MLRAVLVGSSLLAACGGSSATVDAKPADAMIDGPPSAACLEAAQHSDYTWIQANVFAKQCTFSGCHNGSHDDAGMMDLRTGHGYASIVGVTAHLCKQTDIVTAGHPEQSYMMVMLGQMTPDQQVPPSCAVDPMIGLMPQANPPVLLCQEKRDAIERWIGSGALNN